MIPDCCMLRTIAHHWNEVSSLCNRIPEKISYYIKEYHIKLSFKRFDVASAVTIEHHARVGACDVRCCEVVTRIFVGDYRLVCVFHGVKRNLVGFL